MKLCFLRDWEYGYSILTGVEAIKDSRVFSISTKVEDVNAKFDALEKLKENNWQEEEKKRKKVLRKAKAKAKVS